VLQEELIGAGLISETSDTEEEMECWAATKTKWLLSEPQILPKDNFW
jgi:hypothetical protein